ncbi:MAG: glycosyltransferase family 4 protein, partial [Solimonas sp.]
MLEDNAGIFSVPSKILTYQCAGRPVLLAAPAANQAARLIVDAQSGKVCASSDAKGFIDAARQLVADSALRRQMGGNGRRYAEQRFCIGAITDQFVDILSK